MDMNRRTALKTILAGAASSGPLLFRKRTASAPPSTGEIASSEQKAMAAVAENFCQEFNAPGLSIAIAQNASLAYERAFGVTGPDSREQLTTSHLFRIASVSKPITSTAIFSLIEKGQLRAEDAVFGKRGLLGTAYGKQPYGTGIEQITIDHLLTHTCGGWDNRIDDPMFSHPQMNHAELISWTLDNRPLKNPPGKVFAYSNFGYCILGRVIEEITREPYSDYVRSAILSPCGITDMRIGGNTLKDRAANEVTYSGRGGSFYDAPYAFNLTRMDSHGGWIATPADLVLFATHVDDFDVRRNILKPETIRKMTMPNAVDPKYARGWYVNVRGHWWHGGSLPGTTAILVRTSTGFCWAALTNTRCESGDDALDDMMWKIVSKVRAWHA